MPRIRWTESAARDFIQICDYIQEYDAPAPARRVALATVVARDVRPVPAS